MGSPRPSNPQRGGRGGSAKNARLEARLIKLERAERARAAREAEEKRALRAFDRTINAQRERANKALENARAQLAQSAMASLKFTAPPLFECEPLPWGEKLRAAAALFSLSEEKTEQLLAMVGQNPWCSPRIREGEVVKTLEILDALDLLPTVTYSGPMASAGLCYTGEDPNLDDVVAAETAGPRFPRLRAFGAWLTSWLPQRSSAS